MPASNGPQHGDTSSVRVALSTVSPLEKASELARKMVGERVAACVNIIPHVRSIYRWEGRIQDEDEALMVIKTTVEREADLKNLMKQHHPYDVPELLFIPCDSGLDEYISWISESCRKEVE